MEDKIYKVNKTTKLGLILLMIQFVLGSVVGLWHKAPSEGPSPALANLAFNLHIAVAILLLIVSIILVVRASKVNNQKAKSFALRGLISVILAIIGASFIFWFQQGAVWGLFIMAIGFLGAVANYVKEYIVINRMR